MINYTQITIFSVVGVVIAAIIFAIVSLILGFIFKPRNVVKEQEIANIVEEASSQNKEEVIVDDSELIAVISASISAANGMSSSSFRIRSVKEATTPIWGMIERFKQI